MTKEEYRAIYQWRLTLESGEVIVEGDYRVRSPSIYPINLSRVTRIDLQPFRPGYPECYVDIPLGCSPLFEFDCYANLGGQFLNMVFKIGYTGDKIMTLCIDCNTKVVSAKLGR